MKVTLDLKAIIHAHSNPPRHRGAYHALLQHIIPSFLKLLLEHTDGNKSAAARIAGLNRSTLNRKIQHYNMRLETKVCLPTPQENAQ